MSLSRWRETGGGFVHEGHRIFVRSAGQGEEALLLLHGFPTASWDFEAMWPGLTRRFERVIAFDMLGFGFSDKPPQERYSVQRQADLAQAVLRGAGVRRVHLFAHDYGAFVAAELLARAAEGDTGAEPRSAMLMGAALFPEAYRPALRQRLLLGPFGPLYLRLAGPRWFARAFSPLFGPQTRPGLIELHDYWTLISAQQGRRVLRPLFRFVDERRALRERWTQALVAAPLPLRYLGGGADAVAGPAMAKRYAELVPEADVVLLDGIGHYPHVEAPDRTLRALLAFHDRRGGAR